VEKGKGKKERWKQESIPHHRTTTYYLGHFMHVKLQNMQTYRTEQFTKLEDPAQNVVRSGGSR
jgi:hypothetical protein